MSQSSLKIKIKCKIEPGVYYLRVCIVIILILRCWQKLLVNVLQKILQNGF